MKHHEHYLGWTIEWETIDSGEFIIWIFQDWVKPSTGVTQRIHHRLDISEDIEESLDKCREIINSILTVQNACAFRIVREFNDSQMSVLDYQSPVEEDVDKIRF